ncbi:MAG: HemK2/MTQ2 family protein methyltransferase [Euryarchaeota archaeon]|nr:HemK2/MTQ2 family protein methyltransferase [Euryarchaeota archaeon]
MDMVYPPSEDTFLLLDVLKEEKIRDKNCLEIGVGSGVIANFLAETNNFDGVDINPTAIEITRKRCRKCRIFYSDLFSHVRKRYDIIVFNPPYLPEKREIAHIIDRSWHGGEDGRSVVDRFLREFDEFLNTDGKMYLLQSSFCDPKKTLNNLRELGYTSLILKRKKLFFEELMVIKTMRAK